jgi:hypothetical protein
MSKKHGIDIDGTDENFVPDDDFEYEKELAQEEKAKRDAEEERRQKLIDERKRQEKAAREARDRKIAQDKIELMKLKSGVIDESEEIKEVHEEKRELKGFEKISNIWYHDKMWICFAAFTILVVGILVYDVVTREKPDLTIMLIADNGLGGTQQTELLEEVFEQYTPDLNGDGEVHVQIMNCALNDYSNDTMYTTNSQKFFANLQQGSVIMVITDSNTDPDYQALMVDNLTEQFPDNPYIDEQGLSLNFGFLAEEIEYSSMPNDIHLCLRRPVATLDDTIEEMQENYDEALEIFTDIANGLAEQAKETNDKGLETEPKSLAEKNGVTTVDSKSESSEAEDSK